MKQTRSVLADLGWYLALLVSAGFISGCGTTAEGTSEQAARHSDGLRVPVATGAQGNGSMAGSQNAAVLSAPKTPVVAASGEVVVQMKAFARGTAEKVLTKKMKRGLKRLRRAHGLDATAASTAPEIVTVEIDSTSTKTVDDVVRELQQVSEVEYAEPNYRYTADSIPNDPNYPDEDHLPAIGAAQAWDVTTGADAIVAVIDTGVDLTHPDLAANLWHNPGEIPDDGYDNDHNGFVDDVTGYDFVSATSGVAADEDPGPADNNPTDVAGHGTEVAGVVAAVGNNANQLAGVAWSAKVMPIRAGYKTTSGGTSFLMSDIVNALHYAADNGAHVVNMSFGGFRSNIMADAVAYAINHNVVVVGTAGNLAVSTPRFPAAYDRVLSVAATDDTGALAGFSSFGPWVDIAAPGVGVLTTKLGGGTVRADGTSLAAPIVAGTAALVHASHPTWSAEQIASKLTSTARATSSGSLKAYGVGMVQASAAVLPDAATTLFKVAHFEFEELAGDGDGQIEPGETGRLHLVLKNYGPTSNATVTVQTLGSGVTLVNPSATLQQVGFTRMRTAAVDFTVPAGYPLDRTVPFTVTTTAGSLSFTDSLVLDPPVAWAPELVLANKHPVTQTMTALPDGSLAVIGELQTPGGEGGFATAAIYGIVKQRTGQWTSLTQLNTATIVAHKPSARLAVDGGLDVVYEANVGPWNNQLFYRHYFPATASWGPEEQVTTDAVVYKAGMYVTSNHAIASDHSGRVHVAWVDSGSQPPAVRTAIRTASGWSAPAIIANLSTPNLVQTWLDMFVLPDDSRELFIRENVGGISRSEIALSGSGNLWDAPQQIGLLYETFPTFLQGSDLFRIGKRSGISDDVELFRFGNTSWYTESDFTANLTDRGSMVPAGAAAMNASAKLGMLVLNSSTDGSYTYYSGPAGALMPTRATARTDLTMDSATLALASDGTAYATFGEASAATNVAPGRLVYRSSVPEPGLVLPAKPSISASLSSTGVTASWSIANATQVSAYSYAVGTAPGTDDVYPWSQTTDTNAMVDLSDRPPVVGDTYYVSVRGLSSTGYVGVMGFSAGLSLCTPEADATFCTRLGDNCGSVAGTDNCGAYRSVASCGSCTAPQTCGGGGTPNVCGGASTPCSGLCQNPVVFTSSNFQSGNLGSSAVCYEARVPLSGLNCGNFATGRTFTINGVAKTCNGQNVTLPANRNGGYCVQASAGNYAWAYFSTW